MGDLGSLLIGITVVSLIPATDSFLVTTVLSVVVRSFVMAMLLIVISFLMTGGGLRISF